MNEDLIFKRTLLSILGVIAFVLVVGGLRASQGIVVPIMLAGFIALLASPMVATLERRGWPTFAAVGAVLAAIVAALLAVGLVLGSSVQEFAAKSEDYKALFTQRLETLTASFGDETGESLREILSVFDPGKAMSLAASLLSSISSLLGNAAMILLIAIFILLEFSRFPDKLRSAVPQAQTLLDTSAAIAASVKSYITIKTGISLATGIGVGVFVALQGLDFAVLWGLLAFLLNFIPNIGSLLAAIPAVTLSLIQLGPGQALLTAGAYLLVNTVLGSIIEPRLAGKGVGLSPLVVILSLVFWGWVLGPVGMLLSVPLAATVKIALEVSPSTRWLAVLLGPAPAASKPQP